MSLLATPSTAVAILTTDVRTLLMHSSRTNSLGNSSKLQQHAPGRKFCHGGWFNMREEMTDTAYEDLVYVILVLSGIGQITATCGYEPSPIPTIARVSVQVFDKDCDFFLQVSLSARVVWASYRVARQYARIDALPAHAYTRCLQVSASRSVLQCLRG